MVDVVLFEFEGVIAETRERRTAALRRSLADDGIHVTDDEIAQAWRANWEYVIPFLSLPGALRKAVYTTNTIEALHRQIRKAIKTRGHFPDEQSATKLIYLAIIKADAKWQRHRTWTAPRAALKIHFGDRFPG